MIARQRHKCESCIIQFHDSRIVDMAHVHFACCKIITHSHKVDFQEIVQDFCLYKDSKFLVLLLAVTLGNELLFGCACKLSYFSMQNAHAPSQGNPAVVPSVLYNFHTCDVDRAIMMN